jgi:hypothetical protein
MKMTNLQKFYLAQLVGIILMIPVGLFLFYIVEVDLLKAVALPCWIPGLIAFFVRSRLVAPGSKEIEKDERDAFIEKEALIKSNYVMFVLLFIPVILTILFIDKQLCIASDVLVSTLIGLMFLSIAVRAVTVLFYYARK